jgi:hypothetical protein
MWRRPSHAIGALEVHQYHNKHANTNWYIEKTCEKLFDQWVLTIPRVLSPENAFPVERIFLAQRSAAWPYLERLSSDINL